jgi:hypothetical protein
LFWVNGLVINAGFVLKYFFMCYSFLGWQLPQLFSFGEKQSLPEGILRNICIFRFPLESQFLVLAGAKNEGRSSHSRSISVCLKKLHIYEIVGLQSKLAYLGGGFSSGLEKWQSGAPTKANQFGLISVTPFMNGLLVWVISRKTHHSGYAENKNEVG